MADDTVKSENGDGSKKGKGRTILIVALLLVVEAGVLLGAMMLVGGDPNAASAEVVTDPELAELEKVVEIAVLDAKLPNAKSGVTYIYNTEIFVQVKQKYAERVTSELEQFSNEIKADISAIWRTSDPRHFQEPRLENLSRKVEALLSDRFGSDAESGEPILIKCVIVMGTGFRIDN